MEQVPVVSIAYSEEGSKPANAILRIIALVSIIHGGSTAAAAGSWIFLMRDAKLVTPVLDYAINIGDIVTGALLAIAGGLFLARSLRRFFVLALSAMIACTMIQMLLLISRVFFDKSYTNMVDKWPSIGGGVLYLIMMTTFPVTALLIVRRCSRPFR